MQRKLISVLLLACLCSPISILAQEQPSQKNNTNTQANMAYISKEQSITKTKEQWQKYCKLRKLVDCNIDETKFKTEFITKGNGY